MCWCATSTTTPGMDACPMQPLKTGNRNPETGKIYCFNLCCFIFNQLNPSSWQREKRESLLLLPLRPANRSARDRFRLYCQDVIVRLQTSH